MGDRVNYGYHGARLYAAVKRDFFWRKFQQGMRTAAVRSFPYPVYTFTGVGQAPEVAANLLSFWRNVGEPVQWVIVHDGSFTAKTGNIFHDFSPRVRVMHWEETLAMNPEPVVSDYARVYPLGKKLSLLRSLAKQGWSLYVDSDFLFFPGGESLGEAFGPRPSYLLDNSPALDVRLLEVEKCGDSPVNSGLLVFGESMDWTPEIARLAAREASLPDFWKSDHLHFTEQAVVHLAMHRYQAGPLNPRHWAVALEDQFQWAVSVRQSLLHGRHFVSPVRHKMWQSVAWS